MVRSASEFIIGPRFARTRWLAPPAITAKPLRRDEDQRSARAIGAGVGIPPQRRNIVRPRSFRHASQPGLFQFPVDPHGCPVGPADHGQSTQGARKCNQRRHRSILVVHVTPPIDIVAQAGPVCNRLARDQMARPGPPQNPNLAQIALLSSAEISSSGSPASPSSATSVPAPADLRPNRPDSNPVAGAITGVSTLSP
jgi:hypothetical protein